MPRRSLLFMAWLGATFVAVVIASAAVGAVRVEVTDQPRSAAPFFAEPQVDNGDPERPPESTTTVTSVPESSTSTSVSGVNPTTTATQPPATTTTTQTPATSTTTQRPVTSTTTTTTIASQPTRLPPYQLAGGTVTIEVMEPYVWLVGAVPSVGFTADVEHAGPEKVEVEFEAAEAKSEFSARWDSGQLVIEADDE